MDVEVASPAQTPQTPQTPMSPAPSVATSVVKSEPTPDAAAAAAAEVFAPISMDGSASAEGALHRGVRYFCGRTLQRQCTYTYLTKFPLLR